MTIRAYLNEGPHIKTVNSVPELAFGIQIQGADLDPFILIPGGGVTDKINEQLITAAKYYTLYETFTGGNTRKDRETGIYKYKGAKASVKRDANRLHTITSEGSNLVDIVRLTELIQTGKIAPSESFEEGQVKNSVTGVKQALLNLIESIALWWNT